MADITLTIPQVKDLLDQYGVPYWTFGKNVSEGWVNIQCPFCFPAGATVLTDKGLLAIEDVQIGDKVLSRGGKYNPVYKLWQRKLNKESVVEYYAYGMTKPARSTTNHKLFCAEVLYGKHLGGYVEKRSSGSRGHQTWFTGKLKAGELVSNSHRKSQIWLELPDVVPTMSKEVEDAYILGLYCAEGFIGGTPPRTVTFCLHEKEQEYADRVIKYFGKGTKRYSKLNKAMYVDVHSVKYVSRFSECGFGCEHKWVPDDIMFNANRDVVQEFIDGVFDGDGHTRHDNHCTLGITSPTLALQVSILLRRLGYPASLSYTATHVGNDGIRRKAVYTVGYNKDFDTKQRHPFIRCIEGTWYGRLTSRKLYRKLKCEVYNLGVSDDATYTVNGSVVKNCDDHSNHCGIDPPEARFNCWRCDAGGKVVNLVMEITGLGYRACMEMLENDRILTNDEIIQRLQDDQYQEFKEVIDDKPVTLPDTFELITPDTDWALLSKYEERRNIPRDTLVHYGCGVSRYGEHMNRMIIPVTLCGRVMAYQAADLTGWANIKYNTRPSGVCINHFLYNYDRIDRRMILTEGVTDAWRVGDEATASFGKSLTDEQVYLIEQKELDELYICWDYETYWRAQSLIKYFAESIPVVKVIDLPFDTDPDEIGREYIYNWISEN